ncbi:MAG: hypothetical protein ABI868_01960 [Acidobacteriota bacterium]
MNRNATVRQQTLDSIQLARDAATGLGDRATQQGLRDQVSLAIRELTEAEAWVHKSDGVTAEAGKIVELLLDVALWRLTTVGLALETGGPDARLVM